MSGTAELPYRVLVAESNSPEWLAGRQGLVGASESAAILGDSAWGTPRSIYEDKVADDVRDSSTDLMEFGHLAEPLIVAFMENHPERYGWIGEIVEAEGLLQSVEWPWLGGTLDREVICPDGTRVPLELKSVNDFVASDWRVGEFDDEGDDSWRDVEYVVPKKYQVQVQQQMAVKGAPFAYVAVWLGKGKIVVIRVDRDEEYIQENLVGLIGDFWNFNVVPRVPPPPTMNDNLWEIWPGDNDLEAIIADEDLLDDIGKWRIATTDVRDAAAEIKELKFRITDRMGNVTVVKDPLSGEIIHTLRPQNTSRGTDYDKLAVEFPDAYEACVRPAGRTRVHRATKVKI